METFAKYVGIPGLLALLVTVATIVWVSVGTTIPEPVWALIGAAWTYYFATNGKVIAIEARLRQDK